LLRLQEGYVVNEGEGEVEVEDWKRKDSYISFFY